MLFCPVDDHWLFLVQWAISALNPTKFHPVELDPLPALQLSSVIDDTNGATI